MKTLLFLSKGEQSVSTRYRAIGYFPMLRAHGWTPQHLVFHGNLRWKKRLLQCAAKATVVIVLRHGLAFPFLQLLRRVSHRLIFDFDDAVFLKSDGQASGLRMRRFSRTVALADGVLAGNQYLLETAQKINPHTAWLPTPVTIDRYAEQLQRSSEYIDLVWIGSRSTRKYLENILPVLEQAAAGESRLRLKIVADFTLVSAGLPILTVPWQDTTEVAALLTAHIGIAPLSDNPWTRGKCALKVLQYMASRLPVISSPVGANAEIIRHGETGFLADTAPQWSQAISQLATSAALREHMGRTGQAFCRQHYSRSRCTAILLKFLEEMIT